MNKFSFKLNKRGIVVLFLVFAVLSSLTIFNAYGKYTANGTVTDSISLNVISKQYILETGLQFNTHVRRAGLYSASKIVFGYTKGFADIIKSCTNPVVVDSENKGTIKLYWDTDKTTAYVLSDGKIMANPDCSSMFWNLSATELQPYNLSTSLTTNMSKMFEKSSFTELDLNWMDTSNVTDMSYMFDYAKFTSLSLDAWDTHNVTTMESMFSGIGVQTFTLPETFNTSNVTNMSKMFQYAKCTAVVFPSTFDTGNVTTMAEMFDQAKSLTSLDLSFFNTVKVTTMERMFRHMQISSLDLHSFSNTSLENCNEMFRDNDKLESIYLCGFTSKAMSNISYMFADIGDRSYWEKFYPRIYTLSGISIADSSYSGYGPFYRSHVQGPAGKSGVNEIGYEGKYAKQARDGLFTICQNPTHNHSVNTLSSFSVVIDTTGFGNMTASQTD